MVKIGTILHNALIINRLHLTHWKSISYKYIKNSSSNVWKYEKPFVSLHISNNKKVLVTSLTYINYENIRTIARKKRRIN